MVSREEREKHREADLQWEASANPERTPSTVEYPLPPKEHTQLTQLRAEQKYFEKKLQGHIDASIKASKKKYIDYK